MKLKILFSKHAKTRILQRGINKETVMSIIKNPDYTVDSFLGRVRAIKRIGNSLWHVVYVIEKDFIKVVTVYYE